MSKQIDEHIETLREELRRVRRRALEASRQNDYINVARLTAMAASLNRSIMEAEISVEVLKTT